METKGAVRDLLLVEQEEEILPELLVADLVG
jgi:hypothetical protein